MNYFHNFVMLFNLLEDNKSQVENILSNNENLIKNSDSDFINIPQTRIPSKTFDNIDKNLFQPIIKYTMPLCHFIGKNIWILKPASLNRGRGISLFNDINKLRDIVYENFQIKGIKKSEFSINSDKIFNLKQNDSNDNNLNILEGYIIQKYIEAPFLINNRKFDIRVWSLVTQDLNFYYFKSLLNREGYLRTSSQIYSLENLENNFVHLTNNAVQKMSNEYSKFETGNQLSFQNFADYLKNEFNNTEIFQDIIKSIKNLIIKSMLSIKKKLNQKDRKYCFEIFGFDFLVDKDLNVWLIEVNTNPCLELSSNLLRLIIPRMVDDCFKLTIDSLFLPDTNYHKTRDYPINGYDNQENLWLF